MKKIIWLLAVVCSNAFAQGEVVFKPTNQSSLNSFAKAMLDEDSSGYLKGSGSIIGRSIPIVTTSKLISEYQGNELSADKKYKDKPVRIKAVASAIKSDIGGRGFIVANGTNAYNHAYLYVDEKDERILSLNKGSKIDFICYGNGMTLSTPMLKPCVFTSDFVKDVSGRVETSMAKASEKNYMPQSQLEVDLLFIYKIYEHKIGDACLKSSKECLKTFELATKNMEKDKKDYDVETMKSLRDEAEKYKDLPPLPIDKKTALLKLFE